MAATPVYLDHAATTAVRPEVRTVLQTWVAETANASAAHAAGRRVREAVEEARERIAGVVGRPTTDIVFTAGGTEADNAAIKGIMWAARERGRTHMVTSGVEHPAVASACQWLAEHDGATLTVVPPRADGTVDPEQVLDAVRPETALVSVMAANNELGAVNDLASLAQPLRDRAIVLHSDSVQVAATHDLRDLPADAFVISGHKIGAPQGVGVMVLDQGVPVVPLLHGGGQDGGLRSGTFAAALDIALGVATVAAAHDRDRLARDAQRQTDHLAASLSALGGVTRNGPVDPVDRLPTHLHVSVDGVSGPELTASLDRAGLHVAAGSACSTGSASRVVAACGILADAVLRLTVGWSTTDEDVHRAAAILSEVISGLRSESRPLRIFG